MDRVSLPPAAEGPVILESGRYISQALDYYDSRTLRTPIRAALLRGADIKADA